MSHAVIRAGGKQFLVEEGQTVRVPSIAADPGSSIELEGLLSSANGDGKISATVVAHGKDQKIVVFKKKRRKQYKRTRGHRQGYTTLKIDSIGLRQWHTKSASVHLVTVSTLSGSVSF